MKTVSLIFVIPDEDSDFLNSEIQGALENTSLGSFDIFGWFERDSNEEEISHYEKEKELDFSDEDSE